jgi:mRNA-degrading endonuclease toxin of MazEF toxin-antitoxin module
MEKNSSTVNSKKQGEIWFGVVREEDKGRPLLIVSKEIPIRVADIDVQVAKITTHNPRDYRDVEIDWENAGLDRKSIVRTSKINTIPGSNLQFRIGKLKEDDLKKVIETVRNNY